MPAQEPNFEDALASLEAIVTRIESSDLPLEEMIAAYEQGSRLLHLCEARITDARQRVEKIAANPDGTPTTEPFASLPATPPADPSTQPNEELF